MNYNNVENQKAVDFILLLWAVRLSNKDYFCQYFSTRIWLMCDAKISSTAQTPAAYIPDFEDMYLKQ